MRKLFVLLLVVGLLILYELVTNAGIPVKESNGVIPIITIDKDQYNASTKQHVILSIGVLSKLSARDRRNAIRETWFHVCKEQQRKVACKFFTDRVYVNNPRDKIYMAEKYKHYDMQFMPYDGGFNFGLRLLWMIRWFTAHYDFDYFLRVDDDYFVCLDRLLLELPYRKKSGLYWGWIHCRKQQVRVDEGFMILSRDIITEALSKINTTLQCHPLGDQTVALWIGQSKLKITYFSDNKRVIHEVTGHTGNKYLKSNICEMYIGLHGSFPNRMYTYWNSSKEHYIKYPTPQYSIPRIIKFTDICPYSTFLDYSSFDGRYKDNPRPCKHNPIFRKSTEEYEGREYEGIYWFKKFIDTNGIEDAKYNKAVLIFLILMFCLFYSVCLMCLRALRILRTKHSGM